MEDNAEGLRKGTSGAVCVGVDNDQNIFSVIGSLIERMIQVMLSMLHLIMDPCFP